MDVEKLSQQRCKVVLAFCQAGEGNARGISEPRLIVSKGTWKAIHLRQAKEVVWGRYGALLGTHVIGLAGMKDIWMGVVATIGPRSKLLV